MKWYRNLFLGERACARAEEIIRDAANERFDRELHLITLAPNGIDLLNIIRPRSIIGKQAALRHMEMVVGIGLGRKESLDVVASIARSVLDEQGDCDVRRYFAEHADDGISQDIGKLPEAVETVSGEDSAAESREDAP